MQTATRVWLPQAGPQTAAILTAEFIDELLFGGAVGGGKSDFLLGDFGHDVGVGHGPNWRGILFRKTYGELEELITRSQELYPLWFPGAEYKTSDKTWIFPAGENLKLRYMEHETDWMRYWGHQYTWIGWDELPSWPNMIAYNKMKARLRSAHAIPSKRIRASGNPGGPGHLGVKQYFGIDKHPRGNVVLNDEKTDTTRMFIRSRVQDNAILMENDPGYIQRLQGLGSDELVRAWLEGDWDVVLGAFFDCWRSDRHVLKPFKIPEHWVRFRSMDWGFARPFSVGWWAVASESVEVHKRLIPKGALVRYREWYGADEPNVGLRLTAEEVAQGILKRSPKAEKISYTVADPAMFAEDGGPSLAERFAKQKVLMRRGDNKRVARAGAQGGWDQMRARLIGEDFGDGNVPMLFMFDTCTDSIRTLPAQQHDETKPEDLDTNGEDHAVDEIRYACMSRPWTRPKPPKHEEMKGIEALTLDQLWKAHDANYRSL